MWQLKVGDLFAPERTKWDANRFEYRYFSGNHMLQICLPNPTEAEIGAFRNGTVHVGLFVRKSVICFLFKIERLYDWSDQAFSIRLVNEAERTLPEWTPGMHVPLSLVLVDSETGVVRALRVVTYSKHFSEVMNRQLKKQMEEPFSATEHEAAVREIYERYPTSKALSKAAILVEKAGVRE